MMETMTNNPIKIEITELKPVSQNRCYTVDDLVVMLGMCKKSVYELLKRKEFKWFQLGSGGRYRIVKDSFDHWLNEQL